MSNKLLYLTLNILLIGCAGSGNEWVAKRLRAAPEFEGPDQKAPSTLKKVPMTEKWRVSRVDFFEQKEDEGSLWGTKGQTNYYFVKNKLRNVGDFLALSVDAPLFSQIMADFKRTMSWHEKQKELGFLKEKLRQNPQKILALGFPQADASAPPPTENAKSYGQMNEVEKKQFDSLVSQVDMEDVDLSDSLDLKVGDELRGEIIERLNNSNYKVRVFRKLNYRNGLTRFVVLLGFVRAKTLNEDTEKIMLKDLMDYQLEVGRL